MFHFTNFSLTNIMLYIIIRCDFYYLFFRWFRLLNVFLYFSYIPLCLCNWPCGCCCTASLFLNFIHFVLFYLFPTNSLEMRPVSKCNCSFAFNLYYCQLPLWVVQIISMLPYFRASSIGRETVLRRNKN